jgi:hypothetical protein
MRPAPVIAETIRWARRGTRLTAPEPRRNTSGTPLLPINSPPVRLAITTPVRSSGGTACAADCPADGPPTTALLSHPGGSGSVNRSSIERPHPELKGSLPLPTILLPENQDGMFLVSHNQSVACLAIASTSLAESTLLILIIVHLRSRVNAPGPPIVQIFTFSCPFDGGSSGYPRLSATGGLCFQKPVARSKARASWSTPRSSRWRPTIWMPTGSPSGVKPHGTEIAGCPVTVM